MFEWNNDLTNKQQEQQPIIYYTNIYEKEIWNAILTWIFEY